MAVTKTPTTALNAVTTTQTSSAVDISAVDAATAYVKIVQVGTATTAATWTLQISPDASAYYNVGPFAADLPAGSYYWEVSIPSDAKGVKIDFTQQVGGTSSTITAQIGTYLKT